LLKDSTFGPRIDGNRVAAAGFSLGGYTMIEIAGGITDPAAFMDFCASSKADAICRSPLEFPTLIEDFKKLTNEKPGFLRHASDSYRDPRVRGVFAMAPALGPAFRPTSLTKISIPVQIVAGEGDTSVPVGSGAKYLAANIPGAKLVIYPGGVGHYVFLDSCTEQGRKSAPMLCNDAAGVDRDAVHSQTVNSALQFFSHVL
jgi:predicted dienelactone hydrolase